MCCVVVCSVPLVLLATFQAGNHRFLGRAHANFYALRLHKRTSYPPTVVSVGLIAFLGGFLGENERDEFHKMADNTSVYGVDTVKWGLAKNLVI